MVVVCGQNPLVPLCIVHLTCKKCEQLENLCVIPSDDNIHLGLLWILDIFPKSYTHSVVSDHFFAVIEWLSSLNEYVIFVNTRSSSLLIVCSANTGKWLAMHPSNVEGFVGSIKLFQNERWHYSCIYWHYKVRQWTARYKKPAEVFASILLQR